MEMQPQLMLVLEEKVVELFLYQVMGTFQEQEIFLLMDKMDLIVELQLLPHPSH